MTTVLCGAEGREPLLRSSVNTQSVMRCSHMIQNSKKKIDNSQFRSPKYGSEFETRSVASGMKSANERQEHDVVSTHFTHFPQIKCKKEPKFQPFAAV